MGSENRNPSRDGLNLGKLFDRNSFPLWRRAVFFSLAYFVCAEAGNFLSSRDVLYVSFWLPGGLYMAVLLLNERRAWPWLVLAAFPANLVFDLLHGTRFVPILLFYCANTVQAVTGAWLVSRFVAGRPTLATLKEFLGLLGFAAVLSPMLGASLGAATLTMTGLGQSFAQSWKVWWGSNAMAILLVSPFVLTWFSKSGARPPHFGKPKRWLEAALLLCVLIAVTGHLMAVDEEIRWPYKFRLLLPLLWAGLRFGPRGAAAANLLVALLMSFFTTQHFTGLTPDQTASGDYVFMLQSFLAVTALVGLIPAIALGERDRTTAELSESEERFRLLTAASFEGIGITENGRIVDANDQLLKMFGYERGEMVGREIIDLVAPESRSIVAESIRLGREEIFEHRLVRKDGSFFYGEARAKHVRVGDRNLLMAALRDVTERKQAEQALRESEHRYRTLVEFLPDAVAVSADDRLVYLNPAGVKMMGAESEDLTKLIGRSVDDSTPAALHGVMRERRRNVFQRGMVERAIEVPLLRSDGTTIMVEELAVPFTYEGRAAILNLMRDITERRQAEELTRTQREVLEMIAVGKPMLETLDALVRMTEAQSAEMICSILLLDPDGIHIRHGAAPSLPADYWKSIDGAAIGPCAGSCGTAAFRREPVFVADILSDPLWADYSYLALPHGLRACWSTPILDAHRTVLGTFAIYYRQPGMPNQRHLRLIDMATQTAAVCIAKHRSDQALFESETRLRMLTDASFEGIGVAQDGILIDANDQLVRMLGYSTRSEMIGKPAIEFAAPESREYVRGLLESGRTAPYEHLAIRKDGTVFPVEVCGRIIAREPHRISLAAVRDITERKRAEEALRESEERLALVFNNTSDIMTLYEVMPDGNCRFVTANRAFFDMAWSTGNEVERKDIIGKSDDQLTGEIFKLDAGVLLQRRTRMMQAISSGRTVRWEEASQTPTGTSFSERADIPILDRDGACRHLLRVLHDVTERKRAEQALRESEEKFSKAFRSCPDAIALSELETGRYIEVNEGYERLFGFSREEVIGLTAPEPGIYQDPKDRCQLVEELRAHGLVRNIELGLLNRHRQPLTCLYGGELIELSGRPFIVSVIHDITDRVRAEAALRENQRVLSTLLSNLPGIVYRCQNDADWTMEFISEGCRELTGYAPEELLGNLKTSYGLLIHCDDQSAVFGAVQTALRERQPFELVYRIRTASGVEKWVWERGRGIFSANGELAALEGFVTDITAKRRAEIERADARLRERRAHEEYTHLLIASQEAERRRIAGELHDSLGQNLLLIKNRAQLALSGKTASSDSRTQLEGIQELASQAIAEVRQISQNLHPYQLDQLGLTRALEAMIDSAAQSSTIAFERKLEPVDEVFRVEAATNFYRVVQEALNNILKHSQARRARIALKRDVRDVRLWIEDDGRGFGVGGQAVAPGGFGLKNIAERVRILGGSLNVDSRPGAGTRLEAIIPFAEEG